MNWHFDLSGARDLTAAVIGEVNASLLESSGITPVFAADLNGSRLGVELDQDGKISRSWVIQEKQC